MKKFFLIDSIVIKDILAQLSDLVSANEISIATVKLLFGNILDGFTTSIETDLEELLVNFLFEIDIL